MKRFIVLLLPLSIIVSASFADDPYHWPYGPVPPELKSTGSTQIPPVLDATYLGLVYGRANKWDTDGEAVVVGNTAYIFFCATQIINNAKTDVIAYIKKSLPITHTGWSSSHTTVLTPLDVPWNGPSRHWQATGILPNGTTCDPTLIQWPGDNKWYLYFAGALPYWQPASEQSKGHIRIGVASASHIEGPYTSGSNWVNLPPQYSFDPNDSRWWFNHGVSMPSAFVFDPPGSDPPYVEFVAGDTSQYVPQPDGIVQRWLIVNVGSWAIQWVKSAIEPYRGDGWKFSWDMTVARDAATGNMLIAAIDDAGNSYVISGQHGHIGTFRHDLIAGPRTEQISGNGFVRYPDGSLYIVTEGGRRYGYVVLSLSCAFEVNCQSEHNLHLGKFKLPL